MRISLQATTHACIQVSRMSSRTTSSTRSKEKLLKGGESQNQAVLYDFCKICTCSFAWGILARCLTYLLRIDSKGVTQCTWHCQTTMRVTQLFRGESSVACFEFCFQKGFCCLLKTSLYFTSSPIEGCQDSTYPIVVYSPVFCQVVTILPSCTPEWGEAL